MENNEQISMRPTAIRYGLIGGLALVVLNLLLHVSGLVDIAKQTGTWISTLGQVSLNVAILVVAIKSYRDGELGGYITSGQCIGLGAFMGLMMGIISGIWAIIFFKFIEPTLIDTMLNTTREKMIDQGTPTDQIDQAMSMTSMVMTPPMMAFWSVVGTLFFAVILSAILSIFMKKNPPFH